MHMDEQSTEPKTDYAKYLLGCAGLGLVLVMGCVALITTVSGIHHIPTWSKPEPETPESPEIPSKDTPPPPPRPAPAPDPETPDVKWIDVTTHNIRARLDRDEPNDVKLEIGLTCRFPKAGKDENREAPPPVAHIGHARLIKGTADTGDALLQREVNQSINVIRHNSAFLSMPLEMPCTARGVGVIEGEATFFLPAGQGEVVFENPADQVGETLENDNYAFRLIGYAATATDVTVDVEGVMPHEIPRVGVPENWAPYLTEVYLRTTDGEDLSLSSGNANFGRGKKRWMRRFSLGGKTPKAVVMRYVTGITPDPRRFRLDTLEIPGLDQVARSGPDAPPGPRGPETVESEGFTFAIKSMTLRTEANREPMMQIYISAKKPVKKQVISSPRNVPCVALDDLGGRSVALDEKPSLMWVMNGGQLVDMLLRFPIPAPGADRLTSLEMEYPVILTEGWRKREILLPALPLKEPYDARPTAPLVIEKLERKGDLLEILWTYDMSTIEGRDTEFLSGNGKALFDYKALVQSVRDAEGESLKIIRNNENTRDDIRTFSTLYRVEDRLPHHLGFKVVKKVRVETVPVRFNNIGLPRKEDAPPTPPDNPDAGVF